MFSSSGLVFGSGSDLVSGSYSVFGSGSNSFCIPQFGPWIADASACLIPDPRRPHTRVPECAASAGPER